MLQSGTEVPTFHGLPLETVKGNFTGQVRAGIGQRWLKPVALPGWERAWAIREGTVIVGHLNLKGAPLASGLHRVTLGMALERAHIGQGHGRRLLEAAIIWARKEGISWIDLGVFAANGPAIALYTKLGFVETGRKRDFYRLKGQMIEDIEMSLNLELRETAQ